MDFTLFGYITPNRPPAVESDVTNYITRHLVSMVYDGWYPTTSPLPAILQPSLSSTGDYIEGERADF